MHSRLQTPYPTARLILNEGLFVFHRSHTNYYIRSQSDSHFPIKAKPINAEDNDFTRAGPSLGLLGRAFSVGLHSMQEALLR